MKVNGKRVKLCAKPSDGIKSFSVLEGGLKFEHTDKAVYVTEETEEDQLSPGERYLKRARLSS